MYFIPEAQTIRFAQPNIESREVWSHYPYDIVIWAPDRPSHLEAQVRAALAAVDPGLVVYGMWPYTAVVHSAFARSNIVAQLDALGDVWAKEYSLPGEEPSRWTVFDSAGVYVGAMTMPEGFEPHQIGAGFLLGVSTNSLGVETVELLSLNRGG